MITFKSRLLERHWHWHDMKL